MITADINNALLNNRKPIDFNLAPLFFYLQNSWAFRLAKLLRITFYIKSSITESNKKLKSDSALFRIAALLITMVDFPEQDLSSQIEILNSEIKKYGEVKAQVERLLSFKTSSILGDFQTTNDLLTDRLESCYTILRLYKKKNIKTTKPTSQLAKDISEHSISTLSKILDAH